MDDLSLGLIIGFSILGFLLCCGPWLCLAAKVRYDPKGTYESLMKLGRKQAHWEVKSIEHSGYIYSYLESKAPTNRKHIPLEKRDIIVMIHGFSSMKDAWARNASHVAHQYHFIAIDLVGHGDTRPLEADSYKMAAQVERLHGVLQLIIGKNRMYHMCGTSMGGHVAGVYAAKYPQQVASLSLWCPAGVEGGNVSKLRKIYAETGRNYLLPTNVDEFLDMCNQVFMKPPFIPRSIANLLWQMRSANAHIYDKIMQDMIQEGPLLQSLLHTITVPTQIQWGDCDYVLDISCLEVFKKQLPSPPDVVVWPQCGHALQSERHKEAMMEYQRWLKSLAPRTISSDSTSPTYGSLEDSTVEPSSVHVHLSSSPAAADDMVYHVL